MDPKDGNLWAKAYQDYARTPLFTAFITLGSFLLTLKTTILQRLREAYETDDYRDRYLRLRETLPKARYYGSLERLSLALATNVGFALTTSLLQMSFGFVRAAWSVAICIGFAVVSLFLVLFLTVQMFLAHREWFDKIEKEQQDKLPKGG